MIETPRYVITPHPLDNPMLVSCRARISEAQFDYACSIIQQSLTPDKNDFFYKNSGGERLLASCQWVVTMVADGKIEVSD